jgi:PAS domain S-box-containing protein
VPHIDAETLDALPDAVIVAGRDGRIVHANASVATLLGCDPAALIGRSLHEIQPERMHAAHDEAFARWARGGRPRLIGRPIRVPARRHDGREVDIEVNLSQLGEGEDRLVLAVLRDLSERAELERQLTVLRHLRATTAASAQLWTRLDPVSVLDTLTSVLVDAFDSALARAWLYDRSDDSLTLVASAGMSSATTTSRRARIDVGSYPYKVGRVARERRALVQNGLRGDPEFEQDWVEREGIEAVACLPLLVGDDLMGVMVHFTRTPIPDEVAEVLSNLTTLAAVALHDSRLVDEQRSALAEAGDVRQRLEVLASVSGVAAASLDPDVAVASVAEAVVPAFCDWCVIDLALDNGELRIVAAVHADPERQPLIADLRASYPPSATPSKLHPIHRVIRDGTSVVEVLTDADLSARAVDERHLELLRGIGIASHVVAPLVARGEVIGAVSFVRGPQRPPFSSGDLLTGEDIARRAAIAIDNATLYRTARDAVAQRDEFMAIASHELRTPLAVVQGHWDLLRRTVRPDPHTGEPTVTDVERLNRSLDRLGAGITSLRRLTDELLDVSRLRSNRLDIEREPVDIAALLRQAVEESASADRVDLALPKGELIGAWDRHRLRQVIDNLITNAAKYSPPETRIDIALKEEGDGSVLLVVHDRGIGIPVEDQESIFAPFHRASNVTGRHYPGLGLGLSVSREIVERLGGRIWVESAGDDAGSTFFVELKTAPPDS